MFICKKEFSADGKKHTILGKEYYLRNENERFYYIHIEHGCVFCAEKKNITSFDYVWDWFYTQDEIRVIKLEKLGII